jgi:hypothetical protein
MPSIEILPNVSRIVDQPEAIAQRPPKSPRRLERRWRLGGNAASDPLGHDAEWLGRFHTQSFSQRAGIDARPDWRCRNEQLRLKHVSHCFPKTRGSLARYGSLDFLRQVDENIRSDSIQKMLDWTGRSGRLGRRPAPKGAESRKVW